MRHRQGAARLRPPDRPDAQPRGGQGAATGKKIGSLFFNFGGPGGRRRRTSRPSARDLFPRSTSASTSSAWTRAGRADHGRDRLQGQPGDEGIYSEPFTDAVEPRPAARSLRKDQPLHRALPRTATPELLRTSRPPTWRATWTRCARRSASKLNYLGFSYGTFLGATYASLFPRNFRALVLDGPLDADQYINRPMQGLREQTRGFERALGRFFQACAADQAACSGFGGSDPWGPSTRSSTRPTRRRSRRPATRPTRGRSRRRFIAAAIVELYVEAPWGELARRAGARRGRRRLADPPGGRRGLSTAATETGSTTRARPLLHDRRRRAALPPPRRRALPRRRRRVLGQFDHFSSTPATPSSTTACSRSTTATRSTARSGARGRPHAARGRDHLRPATPYRGAQPPRPRPRQRAAADYARRRPHGVRQRLADCIDAAIEAYLVCQALPATGTGCTQEVPFTKPEDEAAREALHVRAGAAGSSRTRGRSPRR